MKKILYGFFAFILCFSFFMLIKNNNVLSSISAESQSGFTIIDIDVEPNEIYDNSDFMVNEYTIYNDTVQSFDFLLDDEYIDFNISSIQGFTSINPFDNSLIEIEEYSTDPTIAEAEYYIQIGTEETEVRNRIKLKDIGSCYIFYRGFFEIVDYNESRSYIYYFKGKVLVNVVDYCVNSLSYEKTSTIFTNTDSLIDTDEQEPYTQDMYTAIINNNNNLTKYERSRIIWRSKNLSQYGNIFYGYNYENSQPDYLSDLVLEYDNNSWRSPQEMEVYPNIKIVINEYIEPTVPEQSFLEKYWWAFDILILALIVVCFILYGKIQDITSIQGTIDHINACFTNIDKTIEYLDKPKRKTKKEKSLIRYCTFRLLFAAQDCDTAIKEDYYELASCSDILHENYDKLNAFRKNYERFDIPKIKKMLNNIKKKVTPCLTLFEKTLDNQKIIEERIYKERQLKEIKKDKIKLKAKKKNITAELLEKELEDLDFEHSVNNNNDISVSSEQRQNENDEIEALVVNEMVNNDILNI